MSSLFVNCPISSCGFDLGHGTDSINPSVKYIMVHYLLNVCRQNTYRCKCFFSKIRITHGWLLCPVWKSVNVDHYRTQSSVGAVFITEGASSLKNKCPVSGKCMTNYYIISYISESIFYDNNLKQLYESLQMILFAYALSFASANVLPMD